MHLDVLHGNAMGSYSYDSHLQPISVRGTVTEDGSLSLQELDFTGAVVAAFEGTRNEAGCFEGEWTRRGQPVGLPFAVDVDRDVSPPSGEAASWNGLWSFVESTQYDACEVTITKAIGGSLEFDLTSRSGGNSGEISGTAQVKGTEATWKDDETGCEVTLVRRRDSLAVTTGGDCSTFQGAGVHPADGEYRRGQSPRQLTLEDSGALPDAAAEKALARLTGKDYALFLGCFQMVSEEKDLDGFGASAASGGLRGLFTLQEGIVMSAPGGKVWAAVIDPGSNEVRYYTTDPKWARKLPKTFEKWRERFADKKVVFASR